MEEPSMTVTNTSKKEKGEELEDAFERLVQLSKTTKNDEDQNKSSSILQNLKNTFEEVSDELREDLVLKSTKGSLKTILHFACANSNVEIVKYVTELVKPEHRAQFLLKQDCGGRTALHYAVLKNSEDIVRYLLSLSGISDDERDEIISTKDRDCGTVLQYTGMHDKRFPIAEILFDTLSTQEAKDKLVCNQNKYGLTALLYCVFAGWSPEKIKWLLQQVTPSKLYDLLRIQDEDGKCALLCTVASMKHDLAKDLLNRLTDEEQSALISLPDRYHRTILHFCSGRGDPSLFSYFADKLNNEDFEREVSRAIVQQGTCGSVLHSAVAAGNVMVVEYIINRYKKFNGDLDKLVKLKNCNGEIVADMNSKMTKKMVDVLRPYCHVYLMPSHEEKNLKKLSFLYYGSPSKTQPVGSSPDLETALFDLESLSEAWESLGVHSAIPTGFSREKLLQDMRDAMRQDGDNISAIFVTIIARGDDTNIKDVEGSTVLIQHILDDLAEVRVKKIPKMLLLETLCGRMPAKDDDAAEPSDVDCLYLTYSRDESEKSFIRSFTASVNAMGHGSSKNIFELITESNSRLGDRHVRSNKQALSEIKSEQRAHKKQTVDQQLSPIPTSLTEQTLRKALNFRKNPVNAMSVTHLSENGKVLHCGVEYMVFDYDCQLDADTKPIVMTLSETLGKIYWTVAEQNQLDGSIHAYKNSVFMIDHSTNTQTGPILSYFSDSVPAFVCATDDKLVVGACGEGLRIYSLDDYSYLFSIMYITFPYYVSPLPDGKIAFTDRVHGIYCLEIDQNATLEEMVLGLPNIDLMAVDKKSGDIFALGQRRKNPGYYLHVISHRTGSHSYTLIMREGEPRSIWDMSVHGNDVAIAGMSSGVEKYKLVPRDRSDIPEIKRE